MVARRCATAASGARRRADLRRAAVDPLHVRERRLADAVERDEALLVDRRVRARVVAVPVRADAELLQGEVDRARQPRLLRVDAEVEVHEVLLEGVRPLLLHWADAVGLGAELADDD